MFLLSPDLWQSGLFTGPIGSVGKVFLFNGLVTDMRWMLHGKIHKATVTQTRLDYEGSITVDQNLLDKAGIWVGEKVTVANVTNGSRFDTYTLRGEKGSGVIAVNGAAAHLCDEGDLIIIMGYELVDEPIKARIVLVDSENKVSMELVY